MLAGDARAVQKLTGWPAALMPAMLAVPGHDVGDQVALELWVGMLKAVRTETEMLSYDQAVFLSGLGCCCRR